MPVIIVKMWKGRTAGQKTELIKGLTDATVSATGCRKEDIQIMIDEYEKENWGLNGKPAGE